jgi:hypothetical protein
MDFLEFLDNWIHIHTSDEHRATRWLLKLTAVAGGWTIAGMMHGLHVPGF